MAATSSSSEPTPPPKHPFQKENPSAPQGPYSCRRINGGLYVRIDFPGVPKTGVVITEDQNRRRYTIHARAPEEKNDWGKHLTSRTYKVHLDMNTDLSNLHYHMFMESGTLRLFFRDLPTFQVDGILELPILASFPVPVNPSTERPNISISSIDSQSVVEKPDQQYFLRLDSVHRFPNQEEIISYKLDGVTGLCEIRLRKYSSRWQLYARVDLPGKATYTMTWRQKLFILMADSDAKEHSLDVSGRQYSAVVKIHCECCSFLDGDKKKIELKDGVFRLMTLLHTTRSSLHWPAED